MIFASLLRGGIDQRLSGVLDPQRFLRFSPPIATGKCRNARLVLSESVRVQLYGFSLTGVYALVTLFQKSPIFIRIPR